MMQLTIQCTELHILGIKIMWWFPIAFHITVPQPFKSLWPCLKIMSSCHTNLPDFCQPWLLKGLLPPLVSVFISTRDRVAQLYSQAPGTHFSHLLWHAAHQKVVGNLWNSQVHYCAHKSPSWIQSTPPHHKVDFKASSLFKLSGCSSNCHFPTVIFHMSDILKTGCGDQSLCCAQPQLTFPGDQAFWFAAW
jgi:hypothetical protein